MNKLPAVTSFKRTIVITDGIMSNLFADGSTTPVAVIRHGIRGTQNVVKDVFDKNPKDREVVGVQETDTAKLDPGASKLRVEFDARFLPLKSSLDTCNDKDKSSITAFRSSLDAFLAKSDGSAGLREVACRYARNIANGRWLFRNRCAAEAVAVSVTIGDETLDFDALSIPLGGFSGYSKDEGKLADAIARGLSGQKAVAIRVCADVDFGVRGACEVFPSENFIAGKPLGFARSLYKYGMPDKFSKTDNNRVGYAALRDQKIGNALRTIDTWYPSSDIFGNEPIAVEPNGANLDRNDFFRKNNKSAFKLFLDMDKMDPNSDDGMFCIASLIRGGVYSGGKAGDGAETAE